MTALGRILNTLTSDDAKINGDNYHLYPITDYNRVESYNEFIKLIDRYFDNNRYEINDTELFPLIVKYSKTVGYFDNGDKDNDKLKDLLDRMYTMYNKQLDSKRQTSLIYVNKMFMILGSYLQKEYDIDLNDIKTKLIIGQRKWTQLQTVIINYFIGEANDLMVEKVIAEAFCNIQSLKEHPSGYTIVYFTQLIVCNNLYNLYVNGDLYE